MGITRIGGEILVNTATESLQDSHAVTALASGGFAVTWRDFSAGVGGAPGDSSAGAIKLQLFTTTGVAVGAERLVNTATASYQDDPEITALSDGGFVVTWRDESGGVGGATGDSSGSAIKAQAFTAAGDPLGAERLVNTATAGAQYDSQTTALANGGFVVTWTDDSRGVGGAAGDSSHHAVKAQVFTAAGDKVGAERLVNTATLADQDEPQITALSDGGFVVTWTDASQGVGGAGGDGDDAAIKAQVFTTAGDPAGPEQLVNTATASEQREPQIAALSDGGFVVVWMDFSQGVGGAAGDSSGVATKAQVFTAAGDKVGAERLVNTATASDQNEAQVAALSDGGFVVAWRDGSRGVGGATGDSSGVAIKAQVFTAAGDAVGPERLVNTATASAQNLFQVTVLSNGDFVIAWTDASQGVGGATGDSSGVAVKAQLFTPAGDKLGSEQLVNTTTPFSQDTPRIAALPNGGLVVVWRDLSGVGADSDSYAIKAQVFATTDPVLGGTGGVTAFTESSSGTSVPVAVAPAITVSDADSATLSSATVSITGGFRSAEDRLAFDNTGAATFGNVAATYDPATGVLSLTSSGAIATVAQWQAALRAVTYTNTSHTPDTAARTLSFAVSDGTATGAAAVRQVTVTAVDDPPPYVPPSAPDAPVAWSGSGTDEAAMGAAGPDVLSGQGGTDTLSGGAGDDEVFGNTGADVLHGNQGNDIVRGGQDDDIVRGGQGDDFVFGDRGNDLVFGDLGADHVEGGEGDDILWGGGGPLPGVLEDLGDTLSGGAGADYVNGNAGDDRIDAGAGNDTAQGGRGDDLVGGGDGDDLVLGDLGNDTLAGGAGADTLSGGAGADVFRFAPGDGADIVVDFDPAAGDHLDLGGQAYTLAHTPDGSALLTLSGGGLVTLHGVADFRAEFLFA